MNLILKIESWVNLNGLVSVVKIFNPLLVLHCGLGIFIGWNWFTILCGCLWCLQFAVTIYFLVDILAFSKDKETELKDSIQKNLGRRDSLSKSQTGNLQGKAKRFSRRISELVTLDEKNQNLEVANGSERKKSIFSMLGSGLERILRADSTATRFSQGSGLSKFQGVKDNYGYFEDTDNCDPETHQQNPKGPADSDGSDNDEDYGYCYEYEISNSESSHSEDSNGSMGENDDGSKSSQANSISEDSAEKDQPRGKGVTRNFACNQNREEFSDKTLPIVRDSGDSLQQSKTNDASEANPSWQEPETPNTPDTHFGDDLDTSKSQFFATPRNQMGAKGVMVRKSSFAQPRTMSKFVVTSKSKPRRQLTKPQPPKKTCK